MFWNAIDIHRKFIENVKKRSENFQYLWVVERQTKNDQFKGNVHFHMINNKYWKIEKWWNYWIDLQKKNGIVPRDEKYKPMLAQASHSCPQTKLKALSWTFFYCANCCFFLVIKASIKILIKDLSFSGIFSMALNWLSSSLSVRELFDNLNAKSSLNLLK